MQGGFSNLQGSCLMDWAIWKQSFSISGNGCLCLSSPDPYSRSLSTLTMGPANNSLDCSATHMFGGHLPKPARHLLLCTTGLSQPVSGPWCLEDSAGITLSSSLGQAGFLGDGLAVAVPLSFIFSRSLCSTNLLTPPQSAWEQENGWSPPVGCRELSAWRWTWG